MQKNMRFSFNCNTSVMSYGIVASCNNGAKFDARRKRTGNGI